jgi:cobalt transport protein
MKSAIAGALLAAAMSQLSFGRVGTDNQALDAIAGISPAYRPWFTGRGNVDDSQEKALFGLQAGLGGGMLGWMIARRRRPS